MLEFINIFTLELKIIPNCLFLEYLFYINPFIVLIIFSKRYRLACSWFNILNECQQWDRNVLEIRLEDTKC